MANIIEKAKMGYIEQVKIASGKAVLEQKDFATLEEQTDVFIVIEQKCDEVMDILRRMKIPPHECNFVDGVCTICGTEDPNYIPPHEHNFVDGVCTICGYEDPDYIPPHDCNFIDGICTICGAKDPDYIPPHEHNFVNGICTICEYKDPTYVPINPKILEFLKYDNVIFDYVCDTTKRFNDIAEIDQNTNCEVFTMDSDDFDFVNNLKQFEGSTCFISFNEKRLAKAKELGFDVVHLITFIEYFI